MLRRNKWLSLILCVLLVCMAPLTNPAAPSVSAADNQAAIQKKIDDLQAKINSNKKKIDAAKGDKENKEAYGALLKEDLNDAAQQLDLIHQQLDELNGKIADTESQIKGKNDDIAQKEALLKDRLLAMYMLGDSSNLQILLSSQNFDDFLARSEAIKLIVAHDKKLIADLQAEKKALEDTKALLDADKKEVDAKNASLNGKKNDILKKTQANDDYLDDLKSDINTYNKAMTSAQAEIDRQSAILAEFLRSQNENSTVVYDGLGFTWPVPGYGFVSSSFYDSSGRPSAHKALDIATDWKLGQASILGQPIVACSGGKVIRVQRIDTGYGWNVTLDHGKIDGTSYSTIYAHMSAISVVEGQTVKQGQKLGAVGSTGNSTGPHLHLEIRKNSVSVDPIPYLKNRPRNSQTGG